MSRSINMPDGDLPASVFGVATEIEAIRQRAVQRALTYRGEEIMDTTIGVPYLQQVFVRNAILVPEVVATELRRVVGVDDVTDISFEEIDRDVRLFRLTFTIHALGTQTTVTAEG